MQKIDKTIFKNAEVVESFFKDATLIGIKSVLSTYQIANKINNELYLKLQLQKPILATVQQPNFANATIDYMALEFEFFYGIEPYFSLQFFLYQNVAKQKTLIPSFQKIDFLFLIKGHDSENQVQRVLRALTECSHPIAVFSLQISNFKDKSVLVQDVRI
ncbi:MAG: IPExxxVDY family protein [Alphaproteobacteria bacterium]|nr:IPExxxVDY family protein [Alphaproteobacteria bacterium]